MRPEMTQQSIVSIISKTMRDQQAWMRTPAARLIADNFACDTSNAGLPKITAEAQEKYAQARRIGAYDAQGEPVLIEAAQLAAFYSQAREESKVAVHYTLRKFVHKPKGAVAGLVNLASFKTILVEPKVIEKVEDKR